MDALSQESFQVFANDLLAAEYQRFGVWRCFNLGFGVKDGGRDAGFVGEYRGTRGEWRVSIKKLGDQSKSLQKLKKNLSNEKNLYKGQAALVVTNARLTEKDTAAFLEWLRAWATPSSDIIDGSELGRLTRNHPHVARSHGLIVGGCDQVFLSAAKADRAEVNEPLLKTYAAALDSTLEALSRSPVGVQLVGVPGAGRHEVLRHLVSSWLNGDRPEAWKRQILVVVNGELAGLADRELNRELLPSLNSYLFMVPPLSTGAETAKLTQLLSGLQDPAQGGPHRIVVCVEDADVSPRLRGTGKLPFEIVRLPLPDKESLEEWLKARFPKRSARDIHRARRLAQGRPSWSADILKLGLGSLVSALGAQVDATAERIAGDKMAAQEALTRLMLVAPFPAPESEDGKLLCSQVAAQVGLQRLDLVRIVEDLCRRRLLTRREDHVYIDEETWPAVILQGLPIDDHNMERLWLDLSDVDKAGHVKRSSLAFRAIRRLAMAGLDGLPRVWLRQQRAALVSGSGEEVRRGLQQVVQLVQVSEALAEPAAELVEIVLARLESGAPFPAPSFAEDIPKDLVSFLSEQAIAAAPGGVTGAVLELLPGLGWWPVCLDRAAAALIRLARLGGAPKQGRELGKVARSLAGPAAPEVPAELRVQQVLGPLVLELEHATGPGALLLANMIREVATLWLSQSVDESESVGRTIYFGAQSWNEAHPTLAISRCVAFCALSQLLSHAESGVRICGWEGLSDIGAGAGLPFASKEPIPALQRMQVQVTQLLRASLPQVAGWDERVAMEGLVLQVILRAWVEPAVAIELVGALPREPEYLVWRVLTGGGSGPILAPDELADALVRGEKERVKDLLDPVLDEPSPPLLALVAALAQEVCETDEVIALLRRVHETLVARDLVLQVHWFIAAWVEAAPQVFRPIVLGQDWSKVPSALRPALLHGARRAFGPELSGALEGVFVAGRSLGVVARLAEMVARPERVASAELGENLDTMLHLLPVERRAEALFRLAAHPDSSARVTVARALGVTVGSRDRGLDPRDLVAIVREICAGEAGEAATWVLALGYRTNVADALLDAIADAHAAQLAAGRSCRPDASGRALGPLLSRVLTRNLDAGVAALRALSRSSEANTPAHHFAGLALKPEVVQAVLADGRARPNAWGSGTPEVFEHVVGAVPIADAIDLVDTLLAERDLEGAGRVLGAMRPPDDPALLSRYSSRLVAVVMAINASNTGNSNSEAVQDLVERVYVRAIVGAYAPGDRARDRLHNLARAIEGAARDRSLPAGPQPALDQLAQRLRREGDSRTIQAIDDETARQR